MGFNSPELDEYLNRLKQASEYRKAKENTATQWIKTKPFIQRFKFQESKWKRCSFPVDIQFRGHAATISNEGQLLCNVPESVCLEATKAVMNSVPIGHPVESTSKMIAQTVVKFCIELGLIPYPLDEYQF